jgi:hypothetical protein
VKSLCQQLSRQCLILQADAVSKHQKWVHRNYLLSVSCISNDCFVWHGIQQTQQERSTSIVPFLQELEESRKYAMAAADIQN